MGTILVQIRLDGADIPMLHAVDKPVCSFEAMEDGTGRFALIWPAQGEGDAMELPDAFDERMMHKVRAKVHRVEVPLPGGAAAGASAAKM